MGMARKSLGFLGERTVINHLKRKGYVLRGTNYLKKWGEIDLILEKDKIIHFVEVKTVSKDFNVNVSYGTWRPEENVDTRKLKKLFRTIETWIVEHSYEGEWQLDVASVRIDLDTKVGKITFIENVILDT